MTTTATERLSMSAHAMDRCKGRDIPAAAVYAIVNDKLAGFEDLSHRHIAVLVFTFDQAKGNRHSITASNGENLWAIVRNYEITTCFFRRQSQPSGKAELQVNTVVR